MLPSFPLAIGWLLLATGFDSLTLFKVRKIALFFGSDRTIRLPRTAAGDLEFLLTDSFVHLATSLT